MRLARFSPFRACLVAIALACACLVATGAADREPRVILISIDGLMPSSYTAPSVPTPNLDRLKKNGVWADGVIGVLPSVTYPSHTTLVTGVEPAVHGIYDNRILDPEGRSNTAWYYYSRDIKAVTLQQAARARGLRAAAVSWPVTVGMDLDYLVPEYQRSRHPESLSMLRALSWPRHLLDLFEQTRGTPLGWPLTDRDRTQMATYLLAHADPHVLLLHLIELDGAQHDDGPGAARARETLARMDAHVGEILDTIAARGRADRTDVAVVSDHGFLSLQQQLQPNALFKKEGLLTVNEAGAITDWRAYFHPSGGSGYVHVKDEATRSRVESLLRALQRDAANGIRAVWTRADLAARHARPDADFGIDMVDGFYTAAGHDVLVKPSVSRGGHGFDPERPALHASFVLAGPSVAARGSLGVIRMTRIAPTLAAILGVGLSPSADRPIPLDRLPGSR